MVEGFYPWTILLTELMMIAMTVHVINYSGFTRRQKAWFVLTFAAIMLCSAAEFAVHGVEYDPSMRVLLTVVTVIQFSVAPVLGMLFTGALGLEHQAKIAAVYFVVNLTIETVAAPFGLIFKFGDHGYYRGDYFIIYGAFYVVSLVYLAFSIASVGRRFRHRDVFTVVMILVVLVAGIIPMTLKKINVTYIAVAISAIICYIYYNDLVQQDIKAELLAEQRKMTDMQEYMILGLANLIENRDMETGGHISRTGACVKKLAEHARDDGVYADALDDRFISMLCTLAPMHDIGKIVIPDSILKKPGKLTPEEFERMKKHAEVGGEVVREVLRGVTDRDYISFASDIAACHHERWDGKGYPARLRGEEIPLCARIMAIADVFDALISERCYKDAMPCDEAIEVIREGAGTHFDPELVRVFLEHKEDFIPEGD